MADFDEPTAAFPSPPDPQGDGWVLGGRYRVTGRIGSGGMADVFRARDQLLDRDVAVKVFRSAAATADTAAGVERQRAELHALARLNHPNLITLYDGSVSPDERAYLVMELVEGPNLGDRIEQPPPPSEAEIRMIGAQIAEALAYVHEQGMVHRDIKPANILLGAGAGSERVRARLSDFGIVRLLGAERLTQADSTLGTASYLAPEQARGSGVGPAADVYALGLTLVEALTGVRSFDAPTPIEAVIARLDRDPEIPATLPRPWPELLTAMTTRDPAARPTAAQVGSVLRGTADSTTRFIPAVAAAEGATTMLPTAAGASMPPVRRPTYAPSPVGDPEPERRRANVGVIVGLVLAAAIVLLGAALVIATTGGNNDSGGDPAPSSTPPTSQSSTRPRTSSSPRPTEDTSQAQQTEDTSEPTPTDEPPSTEQTTSNPAPSSTRPSSTRATSSSASSSASSSSSSSTPAAEQPIAPSSSSRPAP